MKLKSILSIGLMMTVCPSWALDFGRIPENEISVYVQELDSGKVIAEHRADELRNPASTMKLVTAFTAFRMLGGDYRWKTEFKTNGSIKGDTLKGNVYWVGSGDPVFDQHDLVQMQQQMRDKGIRHIDGHLILDRSLWGDVKNPDDFASDSAESFMTPPDPNMLAYKTVELRAEKEEDGSLVIRTNPPLPNLNIQNKLTLENKEGKCSVLKKHMKTSYKNNTLTVSGKLPESCLGQGLYLNMYSMKEYVGKSFVNQWQQQGGTVSDGLTTGVAPHDAHVLASHLSKPLTDILTDMNKHSNNLIARSVFLKFAGNMSDYKLAQTKAASIVKSELAVAGINTEGLVLENGSGLSRVERLNARMMAQMLEKAYFSPFKNEFISTLPIAGKDGTLKTRLKQPGENLRLKTGTLKDVRALAGYWLGEKPLLVVVIINSQKSTDYLRDLDKLVSKIVQPGGEHWIDAKASCMIRYQA
ncbi:TPA: D-alanyl-D-alanine carboxypeptidase/D-alanyl-D-alanine-endopeptidase [Neisseria subflava]|jgi:D-alanyl-D-alanine carboxypeptidase/D-alanyl-D-alanine-endopeptidase